jgi:hypothetical protein
MMTTLQAGVMAVLIALPGRMVLQGASEAAYGTAPAAPRSNLTSRRPLSDGIREEAMRSAEAVGRAKAPQQAAPRRRWAGRHPVLLGALIGLGAGLAVSAGEGGSSDLSAGQVAAFLGGTGAGIGAAVGGIVGAVSR